MADLSTTYMGLKLRNPVIASSSTHTADADGVKRLEDAGVGAVVLKSIFEEQVRLDVAEMYDGLASDVHPEALEYLRADLPMRIGPDRYLKNIREIKEAVDIPVIASMNCITPAEWVRFARKIESAGADGLELNVYDIPDSPGVTGEQVEERHLELAKAINDEVKLPVSVKIGPFYSAPLNFVVKLDRLHVGAVVMFNRFLQPDIEVEEMDLDMDLGLSRPQDILLPLRWVAICRDAVRCDLALTTGVHDSGGAIKALLAGANVAYCCSVLYEKGDEAVGQIAAGIGEWMDRKGFAKVDDFRGLLRERDLTDRQGFERTHYVKALVGLE